MDEIHLLGQSELEKLDQLVSDYLLFRSFKHTQQQLFLDKRQPLSVNKESSRHLRDTIQRILNAFDSGDYPRLVTLWETYINQKIGTVKSTLIAVEAREMEFLANLCCAIYPFRSEVIKSAGSPAVAAKVAARSMTIFKHYQETKGNRVCQQKDHEFFAYRNVHKIAFLPTHPQYKHMFTEDWIRSARSRIVRFMEKFFTPTDLPVLCTLFERLSTKNEGELKEMYRRRERKLVKFSRSIYVLSNDLLTALESGKPVDKAFLVSFRNRFDNFADVLEPDVDFEEEMDGPGSYGSPAAVSLPKDQSSSHKLSPGKTKQQSKIMHKIADLGHLDFPSMGRDIAFMSSEVGSELSGLLTRNYLLSLADATVKSQVALQGCVLLNALEEYITRPDKEVNSQSSRNSCLMALCRCDILGLRSATTQSSFVDISSGSIGLESRSITRFMFSLAEATRKIPEAPIISNPEMMVVESPTKVPPYERLLIASQVIAEQVFRLVSALSTAPAGVSYLHTFGVRLTASFADFLVALPLPDESIQPTEDFLSSTSRKRGGTAIRTWCLMALIVMTGQSKTNQLVVLKRGGILWLSKTLASYVCDIHNNLLQVGENQESYDPGRLLSDSWDSTSGDSGRIFDMALSLLHVIIISPEAQRFLVGSLNMQRETESLVSVLVLLAASAGRTEYQANMIVATLQVLLRESSTREIVQPRKEISLLRNCTEQQVPMSISVEVAKALLCAIDSSAPTLEDEVSMDIGEILESVAALQKTLGPANPIFSEYAAGMSATGLTFLLRYTSSAGRIFAGEEAVNEEKDGRLRSPPIQVNRFRDDGFDPIKNNQPLLEPTLPRTPPPAGGQNPRFLSHGREINESNPGIKGSPPKSKGGKAKGNPEDSEGGEEEDEAELDEEGDGDGGGGDEEEEEEEDD